MEVVPWGFLLEAFANLWWAFNLVSWKTHDLHKEINDLVTLQGKYHLKMGIAQLSAVKRL